MQQALLLPPAPEQRELLPYGGSALYFPGVFSPDECSEIQRNLLEKTPWKQEYIHMYGKRHPIPRETAWLGEPDARYTYSKIANQPGPWTETVLAIKKRVEALAGDTIFNSVLLNRYRNGTDSVSWHADDEAELGSDPTIGSVSFGITRTFQFRAVNDPHDLIRVPLESGSVVIMRGASQREWQHQVPKEPRVAGERVNLTFRLIHARNADS